MSANIKVSLQRLRRHYDINFKGYDEAALLDMSHTLRVWVDMEEEVSTFLADKNPIRFYGYYLGKDLKKYLWGKQYIMACFPPDGIKLDALQIRQFSLMVGGPNPHESKVYQKRYNYYDWMKSEVVRVSFPIENKITAFTLSRELLINRLANAHGASHPKGFEPKEKTKEDLLIEQLFKQRMLDIPGPYFVLMKTAQEILELEQLF